MEDIYKYTNAIEAPWYIRNKVVQLLDVVKKFLGEELEVKYIFISNWLNNNDYEYGTSLWIFTQNNMIECVDFKNCEDPNSCKLKIYALGAVTLYSQITSVNYSEAMIDIQLPNSEIVNFRAINGNLFYLINIYQNLFFKDASL